MNAVSLATLSLSSFSVPKLMMSTFTPNSNASAKTCFSNQKATKQEHTRSGRAGESRDKEIDRQSDKQTDRNLVLFQLLGQLREVLDIGLDLQRTHRDERSITPPHHHQHTGLPTNATILWCWFLFCLFFNASWAVLMPASKLDSPSHLTCTPGAHASHNGQELGTSHFQLHRLGARPSAVPRLGTG